MSFLFPALILGLVGSLHCAGMCGPLAFAMPHDGSAGRFIATRLMYNFGRVLTYSLLGVIFGAVGKTFALAGFQQLISIGAGVIVLLGCAASSKVALNTKIALWVNAIKAQFTKLLFRKTFASFVLLGLLNGLLPCGLVYVACAAATTTASIPQAAAFMFVFGIGTIPTMFAIALTGRRLQFTLRLKLQKLIPACMILAGVVLIVRGLGLGIPYLSPDLMAKVACCHH